MMGHSGLCTVCCTPSSWLSSGSLCLLKGPKAEREHTNNQVYQSWPLLKGSGSEDLHILQYCKAKMSKLNKEHVAFVFDLKLPSIAKGAIKCCPFGLPVIGLTSPVLERAINIGKMGGRNFANRLQRSHCCPPKYTGCSWTDVSSVVSNLELIISCHVIVMIAKPCLTSTWFRFMWKVTFSWSNTNVQGYILSVLMSLNMFFSTIMTLPTFLLFNSRGSSQTPRPQGTLDLPTCQIRFIASQ